MRVQTRGVQAFRKIREEVEDESREQEIVQENERIKMCKGRPLTGVDCGSSKPTA